MSSAGRKFELQPILQSVVDTASRLCRADASVIFRLEGGVYHFAAGYSLIPAYMEHERRNPILPGPGTLIGRAAMTRQIVQIEDAWTDPLYEQKAAVGVGRSMMGVPLMRNGEPIGVIGLARNRVAPFTQREIDLVATFADQAVIAIENVRLFEAEQQRTSELTELLEQQTATSEVLRVISSSPGDLESVFAAMLENAVRICDAKFGNIYRWDGQLLHLAAAHNTPPALAAHRKNVPMRIEQNQLVAPMMATKLPNQVLDAAAAAAYTGRSDPAAVTAVELGGVRTSIAVPMLKDNELIGSLSLYRQEVRPFTDKQIALVTSFAAQAVIAIENARLLNELRELLEQQTATANVLSVISASPGDLAPVFDAMLESATRLCEANFGTFFLRDGGTLRLVARHVPANSSAFFETGSQLVLADNEGHPLVRVLETKALFHLADLRTDPSYAAGNPRVVAFVENVGSRTVLGMPLIKDDECIGVIVTSRPEVRPFTDKQVELVRNFAAQAVIAIENARLLTELRESLERQTATSDILRVISQSPTDVRPVFDSIVLTAARLFRCDLAVMFMCDGASFSPAAGASPEGRIADLGPVKLPVDANINFPSRAIIDKRVVHLPDWSRIELPDHERNIHEMFGINSALYLPLLRKDQCLGVLALAGKPPDLFGPADIAQAESFRDQALIAIENTRLFNETTEALEQQTATSEVLRVISSSPGDLLPVFQTMLENATHLCGANFGVLTLADGEGFRIAAMDKMPANFAGRFQIGHTFQPGPKAPLTRAAAAKDAVQISDLAQDTAYKERDPVVVGLVEEGAVRSILVVPMLKERELIGALSVYHQEVRPFTDKQIALVTNFASQAVIAIENARLLGELRARTDDLTESLEQQTATADVLRVISQFARRPRTGFPDHAGESHATSAKQDSETSAVGTAKSFHLIAERRYTGSLRGSSQEHPEIPPPPDAPARPYDRHQDCTHVADLSALKRIPNSRTAFGRCR